MTREEERLEQAKFYNDKGVKDPHIHFLRGAEWADSNPYIRYKDIEDAAKEVIDEDPQLDKLWKMIENDLRDKFIDKACEWLKEQLQNTTFNGEPLFCEIEETLEDFRKAMKE